MVNTVESITFAALLRGHRQAAGLSQEALAGRAGLSVRGISDLERGRRRAPYRDTIRLLADALGLTAPERAALEAAARRIPRIAASDPAPGAPLHADLPTPLTPLVGRTDLIAASTRLLRRADVRLVTLTGAGGIGKTRVALEAGAELLSDFTDGAVFVPLAAVTDPALVASAIAHALQLPDTAGRSLSDRVTDYLRAKHLLVVLDNLEHLLAAVPVVAELLLSCPRLAVLATSRAALRLSGEHELPVPPLALPEPSPEASPDVESLAAIEGSPAVELFCRRAAAVNPAFALTAATAPAVAAIVRRLDGLPLAIELAAARTTVLPPAALLERLDRRLTLLTGGARDLPARQQTLHATIAWSHDLLTAAEQALFRRLAVFVGGWTLAAAEAVCRLDGDLTGSGVLDGLTVLVDHNLVQREEGAGDDPRFSMLETIREFAADRLLASDEADTCRRRHAECFLALGEVAEPRLTSAKRELWLARLEAEHDNLRTALRWCNEQPQHETDLGLRLAGSLTWFWYFGGHLSEGHTWLEDMLVLPAAAGRTTARAKALAGAGWLACEQGAHPAALYSLLDDSVVIWRELGDTCGLAHALVFLGLAAGRERDYARSRAHFDESIALFRALEDRWGLAHALCFSAANLLRDSTDDTTIRLVLDESQAIFRDLGDAWGCAGSLQFLGMVTWRQGDAVAARALIEESLALSRTVEDKWRTAMALNTLGDIAGLMNDLREAASIHGASLALWWELGQRPHIALDLLRNAALARKQGAPTHAARLLAAANNLLRVRRWPPLPADQASLDREVALVRAMLGEEAFATAWAVGQALQLEQAVAEALAFAAELAVPPVPPPTPRLIPLNGVSGNDLTERQVTVLRLLAGGQSNKEIAAELALSVHTVERHIVNTYAKIGARGRADAVAYALRHDLA